TFMQLFLLPSFRRRYAGHLYLHSFPTRRSSDLFEFEYKIGFLENLDVKVDESIQVKDYVLELNETEVNDAIGNLRSQYGKMTNPEVSQENDFIYGDLKSVDGSFEKRSEEHTSELQSRE